MEIELSGGKKVIISQIDRSVDWVVFLAIVHVGPQRYVGLVDRDDDQFVLRKVGVVISQIGVQQVGAVQQIAGNRFMVAVDLDGTGLREMEIVNYDAITWVGKQDPSYRDWMVENYRNMVDPPKVERAGAAQLAGNGRPRA